MTHALRRHPPRVPLEMSDDTHFAGRVRRLIGVSIVALGAITGLVIAVAETGWVPTALMVIGWILMPALLGYSLHRPVARYLLAIPATVVSLALLLVAIQYEGSPWATAGWWVMAIGVLAGGSLGLWFWYRWMPVPRRLDPPFSPGRWTLVGIHVGLIVAGWLMVLLAEVL